MECVFQWSVVFRFVVVECEEARRFCLSAVVGVVFAELVLCDVCKVFLDVLV